MSDHALTYLDKSEGWVIGVGPTMVVVDDGAAKNLSSSTLKDDAYAFIFDQTGIMASLSIEGTKITVKNLRSNVELTAGSRCPLTRCSRPL